MKLRPMILLTPSNNSSPTFCRRQAIVAGIVGGVLLSDEQGLPKSNYISWLDRRATLPHPAGQGSFFDCFANSIGDEAQKQLGNEFRPGLPLPFLFCLRDNGQLSSRRCASQDWSRIVFAGGIAQ